MSDIDYVQATQLAIDMETRRYGPINLISGVNEAAMEDACELADFIQPILAGEIDSDLRDWGTYGDEPPCVHLRQLRALLEASGLSIYSEHGVEPQGWVNVHCPHCGRTYETTLNHDWTEDEDELEPEEGEEEDGD